MSTRIAKTVTTRMEFGDPNKYRIAELESSIFRAVAFPRGYIRQLKGKFLESVSKSGVYILVGPMTFRGKRDVYIGESSTKVISRLRRHANPNSRDYKEFWESVVIITTNNSQIKSKTKFVEGELIRYKEINKNWKITNEKSSSYKLEDLTLSEEDFVLEFIDASKLILACLGYDFLHAPPSRSSQLPSKRVTRIVDKRKAKFIFRGLGGVRAEMTIDQNGGFVVSKGSIARGRIAVRLMSQKKSEREELIRSKVLKKQGDNFIFTKDHAFRSVSDAATQVTGSHRNGNKTWKLEGKGITYGEWKKSNKSKTRK